jgi:hypothetical protein
MNRKEFFRKSLQSGIGCCALLGLSREVSAAASAPPAEEQSKEQFEKKFVENWMSDLLGAINDQLDRPAQVKLMEACGRGCYNRHWFKQDIARQGQGSVEKLIVAYKKNFECWREGGLVHIRYGEVSDHCYCPAAYYRPARPNDIHCECTRTTHQTIFETALGRPIKMEIVETLRRGGKTCHFVAHVA